MDGSDPSSYANLPSNLSQIFKDYKEILQMHRFRTPLQIANSRQQLLSSAVLSQKQISDAEHVNSLLQPGHFTRLQVDAYDMMSRREGELELCIPATLMGKGKELRLLWTNKGGVIQAKEYKDFETAIRDFQTAVKPSPSDSSFPKYILKPENSASSLHFSLESAHAAWLSVCAVSLQLQQFIQPHTKATTLVRAHWKLSSSCPTYYFIYQSPASIPIKRRQSSVLEQVPSLAQRSTSEPKMRKQKALKSAGHLIVQRAKTIPELDKPVKECLRLIKSGLKAREKVAEAVFDFMPNQQHQWVFLACKGYTLASPKTRLKIAAVEQKQEISINYLLYPLVARRKSIHHKVSHSLLLKSISFKRRKAVIPQAAPIPQLLKGITPKTPTEIPHFASSSRGSSPDSPIHRRKCFQSASISFSFSSDIMGREVEKYDRIVQCMRHNKTSEVQRDNFLHKYGGAEFWQSHLNFMLSEMLENPHYGSYFDDNVNIEECSFIKKCILRILRGDYNFYYKETLGRLHSKACVAHSHYSALLSGVEALMEGMPISAADQRNIMCRFKELQGYICTA